MSTFAVSGATPANRKQVVLLAALGLVLLVVLALQLPKLLGGDDGGSSPAPAPAVGAGASTGTGTGGASGAVGSGSPTGASPVVGGAAPGPAPIEEPVARPQRNPFVP
jgi:hypothetical protein